MSYPFNASKVLFAGRYRMEPLSSAPERGQAIFLVEPEQSGSRAAMAKVLRADAPGALAQLRSWKVAAALSHPHLVRIMDTGRDELDGAAVVYALMEYPNENLADVLKERTLTEEEVRQVLEAVVDALAYLHEKGLVFGYLGASGISAYADTIKISCDRLMSSGGAPPEPGLTDPPEWRGGVVTPAADLWSLGFLIHEMLKRRAPAAGRGGSFVIEKLGSFEEIVRGCLTTDPERRWTVERVRSFLRGESPEEKELAPLASVPAEASVPAPLSNGIPERSTEPTHQANIPDAVATPPEIRPTRSDDSNLVPRRDRRLNYAIAGVAVGVVAILLTSRTQSPPSGATAPVSTQRTAIMQRTPAQTQTRVPSQPPDENPQASRAAAPRTQWRVIAYTFNGRKDADIRAEAINSQHPDLQAEVFAPFGERGPFLISLGGPTTRERARRLQQTARAKGMPGDTFIQNYDR